MSVSRCRSVLSVCLCACWFVASAGRAAEETKPAGGEAEKPAAAPVDRYAVPEGDVARLLTFIDELQKFRPTTLEEYENHQQKSPAALKLAAERILALEKDPASEVFQKATGYILQSRVQTLMTVSADEQRKISADVLAHVMAKETLTRLEFSLAFSTARSLENLGNKELALEAYSAFGKRFSESQDPMLARYGQKMLGSARRINLPGNEMQLEGKTVDGRPFNWKSYRGKVVLVDFWATWCGPCVREIPNVKKQYELYHDKGFDVVGISLDEKREELKKFIEEQQLPWVCLFEDGSGGNHPMAVYYGVMAIPTVILVDKEGKVVNLNAHGDELASELERLLGPAEPKAAPAQETPKEKAGG